MRRANGKRPAKKLLLFKAFCNCEHSGPDFGLLQLTRGIVHTLGERRRVLTELCEQHARIGLVAVEFGGVSVTWFRWFREQEALLELLEQAGWAVLPGDALQLSPNGDGCPVVCRTEGNVMVVSARRLTFACQLEGTDIQIQSERLYWDELREHLPVK